MTYWRVLQRNYLLGDYRNDDNYPRNAIAGDLRRLEQNAIDDDYGACIANHAGVSPEVAKKVLRAFFTDCGFKEVPFDELHSTPRS